MIRNKVINIVISIFIFFITSCSHYKYFVEITKDLKWVYFNEIDSSLFWKEKLIIGPGSITLKCEKKYVWGMCHRDNVSLFFIINLKTGKIIKNPDMKDVISKYKIKVDFNKSYTQTEIFGGHRSLRAIQRLNEDIKQIIYNEPICDDHIQ